MSSFRRAVRRSRWLIVLVLLCNFAYSVEASNYVSSYRLAREEEKRLAEMAERLGVPVEKLRREQPGLIESLRVLFTDEEAEARKAGQARVEAQLEKMARQVADNPYRPQIEEVKNAYRSHRLDGLLRDLTQLSTTDVLSLPVASRKALLKNVHKALEEDLEPYVPENLPAKAQGKHSQLRGKLRALYAKLRRILDEPDALSDPRLAQTLGKLAAEVNEEVHRPRRGPRFADRPLPLQLREQTVRTEEVTQPVGAPSSAMVAGASSTPPNVRRTAAAVAVPEIAALAQSLGSSPARIFAHVHDNIRFDPKWGAVRSPLGALQEGEGTSWDQAWLLLELLTAAGVEAKVEWGQVEIPSSLLLTLTGTSDPFDAGNLLSTGGVPAVLLVQGGKVVGARLGHVWVKAHIDYIPDRGVKPGTPDAWVRMDPSFKRYGFAAGIDVHSQVPFDLGNYLQSGTELSPRRSYEDALWAYIRANNIDCVNLEQLKKAAQVVRERFPFIPGTLRGKILRVDGEQAAVPESFQQRLTLEVKTAAGAALVSWSTPAPAVYGKRVEIDYLGSTSDDQATLDAYGGVFETPPYLVDLKPVVRVAGATVAQGSEVGSAADTEVWVTMTAPTGPPTVVTHVTSAGERHVLAADFGEIPQTVLAAHLAALTAARAAGNATEEEAETLYLIGAQYLHNLGRDLTDLSGWKWQRLVRLGTEGLITQTGVVTTTVGGAPISFRRGQRNVDIALMPLGMVPADGRRQFRREAFELLGSQSSFLEGEVFNQVLQREGIAAVSALTRSKRAGQALTRVDGSNVDAVLAQADLGADAEAEIREGISRGRIAWVAENRVAVDRWTGTGYVIEDPATGAAAYLISGGYAGGDETGGDLGNLQDLLGSEPWLEEGLLKALIQVLRNLLNGSGGGEGGDDGPGTNQSDPINVSTGNFWRTETDFSIQARGLPILWTRTYNSRSSSTGPLGFGWTFRYGERLEERADGSVLYRDEDGTEHIFSLLGSGAYIAPAGKHLTLTKSDGEFTLRTKDGLVSEFAVDGRLLRMSERNGNAVSLAYSGSGDLQSISDAAGRTVLTVTSQDGKIVLLTDLAGRTVEYGYTGEDLTSVTDPAGKVWRFAYDHEHNLVEILDPAGQSNRYAYDDLDRCHRHVDPLGNQETFFFTRRGRRAVLTDRRGFDSYLEFDDQGRAVLKADPLGNISRSTWDEDNNRTSTTDSRGGVTSRVFDQQGNLLSETNPLNETTSYTYDPSFNQVLSKTDALGNSIFNSYDAHGNLNEVRQTVSGKVQVETYSYDGFGHLVEVKDANGNSTRLAWDITKGALESRTNPPDEVMSVTTDDLGRVIEIREAGGVITTVSWDSRDRISTLTDPYQNTTAIGYDDVGRVSSVEGPRGTELSSYDAAGRLTTETDALGRVTRTEFDAAGNITARIDARGNRTSMSYDPNGRLLSLVDALGQIWTFGYCADVGGPSSSGGGTCPAGGCSSGGVAAGSFCDLMDPQGNVTHQDFDALGRVTRSTDALGNTTEFTFDALGRRTAVTDPLGRETSYQYDELGRLTAVVEANAARTEYAYDANGNLTDFRDAEGKQWLRTYDELNRLETESDPLGNTTTYSYDALGNLKSRLTPGGDLIRYEHEVRRLIAVVLPGESRETMAYDALGRRTGISNGEVSLSYAYDSLDRVIELQNHTLGKVINYRYDAAGNLESVQGPQGVTTFVYDANDRLVQENDPLTGTYLFSYDKVGRRTSLRFPNGVTTNYEYDEIGQILSVVTKNSLDQVLDGYAYEYDRAGNRTSATSLQDSARRTYEYDEVNRLTRWSMGSERFESYVYDRRGNRLQATDDGGATAYTYDAANRLITAIREAASGGVSATNFVFDKNGNIVSKTTGAGTTTYDFDPLGRLVGVNGPASAYGYGYSPDGVRVRETHSGATRRLLYSGEDVLGVFDATGTAEVYYTHGPGFDEPLAQTAGTQGPHYLHSDGLGSVTAASSPAGTLAGAVSYSPFGAVESQSGTGGRYGFTGRELDPSGLLYYRARYYQPEVGRFISADPYKGSLAVPASRNGYAYVHNNPLRYVDPLGLNAGQLTQALPQAARLAAALAAIAAAEGLTAAVALALLAKAIVVVLIIIGVLLVIYITLITVFVIYYWDEYEKAKRAYKQSKKAKPLPYGGPMPEPPPKDPCDALLVAARGFSAADPRRYAFMVLYYFCKEGDIDSNSGTPW